WTKGQVIDLEIDSAAYQGSGVARFDEFVVFVKNAVPGDRVQARVIKKKRHYAEAVIQELIKPSVHRLEPRCKYFGTCGGCSWQNVNYRQQLIFKHNQVEETFSHLGGLGSVKACSTLPSPDIYYYRNKMEFSFGTNRWLTQEEIESGREVQKGFALGLHIPKRWDKILDLDVCYLQSPLSAEIVNEVRKIALGKGWSAYDPRRRKGYLCNLVIRTGSNTGEIMVNLVTSRSEPQRVRLLTQALLKAFPEITTVVNSINSRGSPVAYGTEEIVYHGKGTITDRIAHLVFMITPDAFFQPNTAQAETLCQLVKEFARLDGDETVYDLYSGSGSFALFLSDRVKKVVALESHERAVESACKNAAANKIENCVFRRGDVREALTSPFVANYGRPDVLVADPPRAGMHKDVCRAILALAPERVIYVSCNPATQARDLKILCQRYEIEAIQPVDMFPHTYHIETVVALVDAATG
ncbi:23S rRNA (uracil(1939)-C(5))-methyltransferase RlmD, partial [Acidobacteria bacterium AH-259-A15]|nr:23S rRNA (uracil(1939)-C(5))-methyltransferase RlmD [Acidobacteria bacterium AH-259-A15]